MHSGKHHPSSTVCHATSRKSSRLTQVVAFFVRVVDHAHVALYPPEANSRADSGSVYLSALVPHRAGGQDDKAVEEHQEGAALRNDNLVQTGSHLSQSLTYTHPVPSSR